MTSRERVLVNDFQKTGHVRKGRREAGGSEMLETLCMDAPIKANNYNCTSLVTVSYTIS